MAEKGVDITAVLQPPDGEGVPLRGLILTVSDEAGASAFVRVLRQAVGQECSSDRLLFAALTNGTTRMVMLCDQGLPPCADTPRTDRVRRLAVEAADATG